MSGLPVQLSRLRPEIRLAQAISQFEAELLDEHKDTFRNLKAQTLDSPPDAGDVMRLTAEMDRQSSEKLGTRCIGPRFTNFLQGVQQFAALGDVVVGGSQNILACGVWSLVRMSLLSIVKFSCYIEKLSTLFMDIGRSAPRYQAMALLYPQSKNLQSHLSEYFIVVVGLCQHILKFTRKNIFQKFIYIENDLDLKAFQTDVERWANSINEEANLVQFQDMSRLSINFGKLSRSVTLQQKLIRKLRVLDFCSKYDHETTWKQIRKLGNATHFSKLSMYQKWKDYSKSCMLFWTGKLGSGKSVSLANMVDDLNIHYKTDKMTVAYFFCQHDISESLKSRTIIGCLARQLLCTRTDLAMTTEPCEESQMTWDIDAVLDLLFHNLPADHKAFFILDGLDEFEHSERRTLVQTLQRIQWRLQLHLCISYRSPLDSDRDSITSDFVNVDVAIMPDNNPDIDAFIRADLKKVLENRRLVVGDPTIILEIHDALMKGSQGMFLWAVLQIQSLCDMKSDQAIRDALADLPRDLSETFARILRKSERSREPYQGRILQLLVAACRPLTIHEIREALSVVPGDTNWTPSRLLNDVYSALACCGCLIVVDEEEFAVRFIHHSVQQYLLDRTNLVNYASFTAERAQRTLADIIVTYMNYDIFRTEISKTTVPTISTQSVPSNIVRTTMGSSETRQRIALKFLRARRRPDIDISKTLAEARKAYQHEWAVRFHFHTYANVFWRHHLFYISTETTAMLNLLRPLLKIGNCGTSVEWKEYLTHMCWALENGNGVIIERLVESGQVIANANSQSGWMLLHWAAANGHDALVRSLLNIGLADADVKDANQRTPLLLAAMNGHDVVVKLLLDTGLVDINAKDTIPRTLLVWAIWMGHDVVAKLLLNTGHANVEARDEYLQTPLHIAAWNGQDTVVQQLLDTGLVDVNANNVFQETPLSLASKRGHFGVGELLRSYGGIRPITIPIHLLSRSTSSTSFKHQSRGIQAANPNHLCSHYQCHHQGRFIGNGSSIKSRSTLPVNSPPKSQLSSRNVSHVPR